MVHHATQHAHIHRYINGNGSKNKEKINSKTKAWSARWNTRCGVIATKHRWSSHRTCSSCVLQLFDNCTNSNFVAIQTPIHSDRYIHSHVSCVDHDKHLILFSFVFHQMPYRFCVLLLYWWIVHFKVIALIVHKHYHMLSVSEPVFLFWQRDPSVYSMFICLTWQIFMSVTSSIDKRRGYGT